MTLTCLPSLPTPPPTTISTDSPSTDQAISSRTTVVANESSPATSDRSSSVALVDQNVRCDIGWNKTREEPQQSSALPSKRRKVRKPRQKKYVATSFAEVRESYESERQERFQMTQRAEHEQQRQQQLQRQQQWQWLDEQQQQQQHEEEHWRPNFNLDDSNVTVPFGSSVYYEIRNTALAFSGVSFESLSSSATAPLLYSQQWSNLAQPDPGIPTQSGTHQPYAVTNAAQSDLGTSSYDPGLFLTYQQSGDLTGMGSQIEPPQAQFQGPSLSDSNTGSAFDDLFQSEELRNFTFNTQLPNANFTILDDDQNSIYLDDFFYKSQFRM